MRRWTATSKSSAPSRPPAATISRGSSTLPLVASVTCELRDQRAIFDRRTVFVGSLNLDPRSAALNTEIGLVFESPELATLVAEEFIAAFSRSAYRLELVSGDSRSDDLRTKLEWVERKDGSEVRYDAEPQAGAWRRLGVWFMSWLPIESQL